MYDYLGIVLYFRMKGKVKLTMLNNTEIILDTSPTGGDVLTENPSTNHLFQVQEDGRDLSSRQQDLYKTLVKNILFVRCFPLPNLKTAIAFLTKRVKQPNMNYYKNMTHCVRHRRELPGNHCDFDVVIVIYPFHWITRKILVTTVYIKKCIYISNN